MTIGYLMDILKEATKYICRIAEGDTNLTDEELHRMSNIMSVMHTFIINTPIGMKVGEW